MPLLMCFSECLEPEPWSVVQVRDWFVQIVQAMVRKSYKTRILLNTVLQHLLEKRHRPSAEEMSVLMFMQNEHLASVQTSALRRPNAVEEELFESQSGRQIVIDFYIVTLEKAIEFQASEMTMKCKMSSQLKDLIRHMHHSLAKDLKMRRAYLEENGTRASRLRTMVQEWSAFKMTIDVGYAIRKHKGSQKIHVTKHGHWEEETWQRFCRIVRHCSGFYKILILLDG